ncbi:MAG: hypothetical protein ABR582_16725 [Gemmatimonadaceae bacterium]
MPETAALDPERLMHVLNKHKVKFVLIGALAARLHGFPRLTADADITPATDNQNLDRLASALRELHARIYTESIPEGLDFDCSRVMLLRAKTWNLVTDAGRLDLVFAPAEIDYDDLAKNAERFMAFGVTFLAASVDDIIRLKEAAGRPKDRDDVAILKAMRRRS